MILYHYTAREYLSDIMAAGLWKGQIPLSRKIGDDLNAVWLTNEGTAEGHGLTDGRLLTPTECMLKGVPVCDGHRFPDKRAIRITVAIQQGDRRLVSWGSWGRKRLAPGWYDTLNRVGGLKARTWFLYWGEILPEQFREVRDLATG